MKQISLSILLTLLMSMTGINTFAYDFAVKNADGKTIYYNYINDGTELQVTYVYFNNQDNKNAYKGNVVIPEEVTYLSRTRKVTSIGDYAFFGCSTLTSVTIPNSVTTIGESAFYGCGLTSVEIPNSVTSIGKSAFDRCLILISVTIPNSMKTIGDYAFYGCRSLTSVTIGSSVTSIGKSTFAACYSLTSVTIPNSVTSIGDYAFSQCSYLTSVTIGNSVTSIGKSAFDRCLILISVTIPNSMKTIGDAAFSGCRSLTSVTIGNSVTSIGNEAFRDCSSITSIISKMENPCKIPSDCFSQNAFYNSTLYVPQGTTEKYKRTEYWNKFVYIEEGDPSGGESPEPQKCSKPIIEYKNGQLTFDCATEGATCYYSITDSDIKSGNGEKVDLTVTYHVSVFAAKQGCYNSDEATATLCWIDVDPKMEGIENGVANVKAMPVLIQGDDGVLHISGVPEGTTINVYEIGGQLVGFAKASSDTTVIPTTLSQGSIAIVKIGEKAVKVLMK